MRYTKFSRYPSIQRDLALIVKSRVSAADLINTVKSISPIITDTVVFDVFEGKPINFGYKSIAIRITFTDIEKTLRDDDINPIIDKRNKPNLSNAALETLAIVAYNPKITRPEMFV